MKDYKLLGLVTCVLLVAAMTTYLHSTRPPVKTTSTETTTTSVTPSTNTSTTPMNKTQNPVILEVYSVEPTRVVYRFSVAGSVVDVVVSWKIIADRHVLEEFRSELNKTLTAVLQYPNCTLIVSNNTIELSRDCPGLPDEYSGVLKALRMLTGEIDLAGLLEVNVTLTNNGVREVVVLGTCPWTSIIKHAAMKILNTSEERFGFDEHVSFKVVQGDYSGDMLYRCIPLYARVLRQGDSVVNIFYLVIKRSSYSEPFRGEFYVKVWRICEGFEVNCSSLDVKADIEWS